MRRDDGRPFAVVGDGIVDVRRLHHHGGGAEGGGNFEREVGVFCERTVSSRVNGMRAATAPKLCGRAFRDSVYEVDCLREWMRKTALSVQEKIVASVRRIVVLCEGVRVCMRVRCRFVDQGRGRADRTWGLSRTCAIVG
jgi:hypothetical protein